MCQKNYNIENKQKKEFKYKHLNYTEKTQIERWYNRKRIHSSIGYKVPYELEKNVA